ncbi:hypothetical protein C3492_39550 [Streptomyces sp. Ru62]|uniref:hypothetical protein n=1 Tax=Streptomyces sp. Ru62 TaxID=2080745 RepID=UPI000CDDC6BA|nr:hypothetical protein [Streptomyces sp. Ru62]POX58169.1 hypothetical protein C3492_39550 [Streptomyces sp. Ru62]
MTTDEERAAGPFRQSAPWQAFCLQASVGVFFLAGASAPTPLALLIVGSLSDHVGRRPVIFGSLVVQAAAVVVFAGTDGVPDLVCGRILQGVATGTVVGAVGAGMIDVSRSAGTLANAVTPAAGTAVGAMGSGLLVTYQPGPARSAPAPAARSATSSP